MLLKRIRDKKFLLSKSGISPNEETGTKNCLLYTSTVVNPVLEEAMSMGATLDTSVSEGSGKTEETSYQTGDIIGKTPGETCLLYTSAKVWRKVFE